MRILLYILAAMALLLDSAFADLCRPPRRIWFCKDCLVFDDLYGFVGYTSPKGLGRKNGYYTMATYFCRGSVADKIFPYADIRVHYLDNNRWAGNFGYGIQKAFSDTSSMIRLYGFFDFRDTFYKFHKQISFGAEWQGPYYNMIANFYWPIYEKGKENVIRHTFPNRRFIEERSNNFTMRGFDFMVSKYCPVSPWFRVYASTGVYSYFTQAKPYTNFQPIVGIKFRLEAEINLGLVVAVQTSYDRQFNNRTCLEVSWAFPLGCISECHHVYRCVPVRRENIIVLFNKHRWKGNF